MTTINRTLILAAAILALSAFFVASPWAKDLPFQIKVLSGESRQFQGPPFPPTNCEWRDISAYCYNSSPETYVENTMVVQEPDGKSLEIACTVYNQWSSCTTLPVNQSFEASMGKRGLKIRFVDQRGKMREQLYEINKVSPDTVVHPTRG
jgi:hypothetical protein